MKYLQFSTKLLLLPLITVLVLLSKRLLIQTIGRHSSFIEVFLCNFSLLFAIFPEILIRYRTKPKQEDKYEYHPNEQCVHIINSLFKKDDHKLLYLKQAFFFIIIGSSRFITDVLSIIMYFFKTNGLNNILTFSCLFVTWLMCYLSSKLKLARHHTLGLCIVLFASIGEYSYMFHNVGYIIEFLKMTIPSTIVILILYITLSPAKDVIEKHLITYYFYSSNILLLFEGGFSLALLGILLALTAYFDCNDTVIPVQCNENKWSVFSNSFVWIFKYFSLQTLYAWIIIVINFISMYLLMEINKTLSPMHLYITYSLSQTSLMIYTIIIWLSNPKEFFGLGESSAILGGLSFVSAIGGLIFNEYIILKFCNLHKDTRMQIEHRGLEDINNLELNDCSKLNFIEDE